VDDQLVRCPAAVALWRIDGPIKRPSHLTANKMEGRVHALQNSCREHSTSQSG
jgi:hypothetical protein